MIFLNFFRLLGGYVKFTASDGFSERFINLCSLNSIPLWNLKTIGSGITAYTTLKGYKSIRSCAVKSGMKLKVKARHGLPFFINHHRRRSGVIVGLIVFFCIIAFLSSRIWTIEVNGNSLLTDEEVLTILSEAGLRPGMPKSKLSAPELRFFVLGRMPEISYIAINMKGSCVHAEITERIESSIVPDDDTPCDVVSSMDGQIAVLEVYEGTKMYTSGEAVRQGNVLAAGFVELSNGTVRMRHARAYALIKSDICIKANTESHKQRYKLYRREKHTTLHFFGLDIPLFIKSNTPANLIRSFHLSSGKIKLPVGYTEQVFNHYIKAEISSKGSQQELTETESYFTSKIEKLSDATVEKEDIRIKEGKITGEFTAIFSAGVAVNNNLSYDELSNEK